MLNPFCDFTFTLQAWIYSPSWKLREFPGIYALKDMLEPR